MQVTESGKWSRTNRKNKQGHKCLVKSKARRAIHSTSSKSAALDGGAESYSALWDWNMPIISPRLGTHPYTALLPAVVSTAGLWVSCSNRLFMSLSNTRHLDISILQLILFSTCYNITNFYFLFQKVSENIFLLNSSDKFSFLISDTSITFLKICTHRLPLNLGRPVLQASRQVRCLPGIS